VSLLLVSSAAAFGAATAAFLPRITQRFATSGNGPARRNSACAVCYRPFGAGWRGWVRAGPACCHPGGPGAIMLAGAAICALLAAAGGPSVLLPVHLLAAVLGLLLALIDLRCLRLPNPLVGGLAVIAGVPSAVLEPQRVGPAVVAAAVVLIAYLSVALLPHRGLGLGDVKLAAVLGLILGFAGWPAVVIGLVAPHVINGTVAVFLLLTRRVGRRHPLPFGPALLAGALIAVTAT
jgi:leader peptidase (prepilin peptidase) / N-methyltransferase